MRYAQVDAENRILVFLEGEPDNWPDLKKAGVLFPASKEAQAGWVWDGKEFTEPPPAGVEVPESVTNFQARAVLMGAGLFSIVDEAIKAEGGMAFQAWEYANTISRNGALVATMAARLGLTEEVLDSMFIQASQIEA